MIIWFLFGIILLIIALNDFLFFRIEDEYNISLCVLYVLSCICGVSGSNFLTGLATAVLVFFVTLVMNHCGLIGGGDVKMLFPLILFAENNLYALIFGTAVAGVFVSLMYILFGKYVFALRRTVILSLAVFKKNHKKTPLLNIVLLSSGRIKNRTTALTYKVKNVWKQEIPYGTALSYGGLCVILENLLSR